MQTRIFTLTAFYKKDQCKRAKALFCLKSTSYEKSFEPQKNNDFVKKRNAIVHVSYLDDMRYLPTSMLASRHDLPLVNSRPAKPFVIACNDPLFIVNTPFRHAFVRTLIVVSVAIAAVFVNQAAAQAPARNDKIMSRDELRACMKLQQSNEKNAAEILAEQQAFKRDQDAVKVEQAEVAKINDDMRARVTALATERDAISTLSSGLSAKVEAAKTDAEKAAVEAERAKLLERNAQYEQDVERFRGGEQTQRDRVAALNERIGSINQRSKTVNDRVEPHLAQVAQWKDQCGSRRYREEDEALIRKELAASK
jgi:hypothetical protein